MTRPESWWQRYWFRPWPLADLAACRLVLVGYQLVQLLTRDWHARFVQLAALPDSAYNPIPLLHLLIWPFGWNARPTVAVLDGVVALVVIAGVLGWIGWRTNVSVAAFALGNLFLAATQYSLGKLNHGDAVLMIALVVLTCSPCGAVWSVDALRGRGWAGALTLSSPFAGWPLKLLQWVVAAVYLSAALSKVSAAGLDWMNGYTLQYYMFEDAMRWQRPLGMWLAQSRDMMAALAWFTVLFEGTFVLAVLVPRLALWYVAAGTLMHVGIEVLMGPTFLSLIIVYAVFVPWTKIARWMGEAIRIPEAQYAGLKRPRSAQ